MIQPSAPVFSRSASEVMADPIFRQGHDDAWIGRRVTDRSWDKVERQTYEHGRRFAAWLQHEGETRQRFTRGGVINAELAAQLLFWRSARAVSA